MAWITLVFDNVETRHKYLCVSLITTLLGCDFQQLHFLREELQIIVLEWTCQRFLDATEF